MKLLEMEDSVSLRSYFQDHPWPLVLAWRATDQVLHWVAPIFERIGLERTSRSLHALEMAIKKPLFDCRECGQCVLHYTGMTCPMTCPKNLRNGPCGGVRLDGTCEVYPDRDCVWLKAVARSANTPWHKEITRLNPPVDWRLQGMSAWTTYALGRDQITTGCEQAALYAEDVMEEKHDC